MSQYIKTDTFLDKILARKVEEVARDQAAMPLARVRKKAELATDAERRPRDFVGALHKTREGAERDTIALIAEVKKASPSKGLLMADFDAVKIATTYAANGAAALSVLTDEDFFQGHIGYLGAARKAVSIPVLRKDFTIDAYQVYYARAFCADAVLLIVAALDDAQLADFHALIHTLGMAALVEVHTEAELERALKIGASLIGINNRDLKTFHTDIGITEQLARLIPQGVTIVAESGLHSGADVQRMGQAGAHAVLVGEALVKAENMGEHVRTFSTQKRTSSLPNGL